MAMSQRARDGTKLFVEFLCGVLILIGLAREIDFFRINGFLPAPFVFDVSDTFMDWFNTAYYAHNAGAYSAWHSIYAPLSFIILKIFGMPHCYNAGPMDARDCDIVGVVSILASYVGCVVISAIVFFKNDRSTAILRTLGFGLGLPLLYALERGNLIMMAFMPFMLLFGGVLKSRGGIAAAAAFIINMKYYLLMPVMAFGIKRDWRTLEISAFATLALYLVTMALMNGGTPAELYANLKTWFSAMSGVVWDQVYYSTTYKPYLLFDERNYPVRDFIEQRTIDYAKMFINIELIASRSVLLLCIAGAWFYPKTVTLYRLAFFILMQSFVVTNPGGYGISFLAFLVFLERWKNFGTGLAIITTYIASIPTDHLLGVFYSFDRFSWLSNRVVDSTYGISVGALIRPGLLLVILWSLAIDSLIDIHRAVKSRAAQPQMGPPVAEPVVV